MCFGTRSLSISLDNSEFSFCDYFLRTHKLIFNLSDLFFSFSIVILSFVFIFWDEVLLFADDFGLPNGF